MLNDLFRTYKKIIIAVVLLLSAIIFWFFGCHRTRKYDEARPRWTQKEEKLQSYDFHTDHISGTMTFGSGGHLSADRSQPVLVQMTAKKEPFAGTIRITLPGENARGVAWQYAVSCQPGKSSEALFRVPRLGNVSYFGVEILDQYGGEELAEMIVGSSALEEAADSGQLYDRKTIQLGALCDHIDKIAWMNDTEVLAGQTSLSFNLTRLDEQDLLGGAEYLSSYSGIVIDDYNCARLSPEQRKCLMDWVEKEGGCLIIAAGAAGEKTLAGFEASLGIYAGDQKEESLQFYDGEENAGYLSVLTRDLLVKDASWKPSKVFYPISAYLRGAGGGRVMVLAWSLTDDALDQWTGRDKMASELSKALFSESTPSLYGEEDTIWQLKKALYSFLEPNTPDTFYYALYFFIYLLTLGFFAYYLLRRIKKREAIWIVVPVIAVFFTVCIAIRGRGVGAGSGSSCSVLEVIDSSAASQDLYLLYQNTEGKRSRLGLIPDITHVEPLDYNYRIGNEDVGALRRLRQEYTINHTKKGYDIEFEETVPGTSHLLRMTKKKNEPAMGPFFEASLQGDYSSFEGTITNRSLWHFSRVILVRGSQYMVLGGIRPGQKKAINREETLCWTGFDEDNSILEVEEDRGSFNSLKNYLKDRIAAGGDDFNTVYLCGITEEREISLLTGQGKLQRQQTVLIDRAAIPCEKGVTVISDINRECLTGEAAESTLANDILEEKKLRVVYQFDRDKRVWAAARNRDRFTGRIMAYNVETGKEEEILKKPDDQMDSRQLAPYLSETNKLTLTFRMPAGEDYGGAPVVTVALKDED